MRGLVSFCIFGDGTCEQGTDGHEQAFIERKDIYYGGAIKNAEMYAEWQPEWTLRFYVGESVPDSLLGALHNANGNTEVIRVDEPENQTATWWRFRAISTPANHDFIIFRDVDSRPFSRERVAVEEWLQSSYPYHVMRDHQFHGRQLLAGLWGLKSSVYYELSGLPSSLNQSNDFYGGEQIELLLKVWPQCRRKIMAHIGCYNIFEKVTQRRPFSISRTDVEPFCAQGLYADGTPRYPGHEKCVDSDDVLRMSPDIFSQEFRV